MIFEVKNLSVTFENHSVFKNASFAVDDNDFICIVGPNGCGKSTLLNCILGLLKPTSGKIEFKNNSYRKQIGYLPQSTKYDAYFPTSVYEVVSSGALNNMKLFSKLPKDTINTILKELKIDKIKNEKFSNLSGGQRQKVLLARAILAGRKLLILDEPSNNLDFRSRQNFVKTLKTLNNSLAIIMVTHDLDHSNLVGDKILSLDPKHPFFGPTEEYVRRIHHAE